MKNTCLRCEYMDIINDRDPHDWFNDDDVALICLLATNTDRNKESLYISDRHKNRAISKSLRPYEIKEYAKIPEWCPFYSMDLGEEKNEV